MALLGQSAFLKALGWALLNSIWQMAALWVIYLLLTASLRKLTADIKHSLATLLLGVGSVWFALTLAVKYFDYSESPIIIAAEGQEETLSGAISLSLRNLEAALPYLSSVYLVVIVFMFFRFLRQYRYTKHVSTNAVHKVQPQFRLYVQQIAERMGIKKDIKVWLSEIVDTPMTIGFWKPIILMPIASVNGLSTQQVEAILLHELSHIRRNDYLVNLMITSIDIVLFFNPFSRLFIRTIKKERENSCDDLVLQFQYNAHAYASALLAIEQKRVLKVALGMAATGKNNRMLLDRVKRILNQPVSTRYNNRMVAHLFAGMLLAFIAWSNPGNVIVKSILPQPETLALKIKESKEPVFVSQPIVEKKVKVPLKKQTPRVKTEEEVIEELVLSEETSELQNFVQQVAFETVQYAPQAMYAAGESLRDFSITEQIMVDKPIQVVTINPTPYVPSTSFSYYMQDSTKPGVVVVSPEEKAATEALKKALKALEEIDWNKLEKELKAAGDKIDFVKLQEELKKSLKQIDWEKVNAETRLEQLQAESKKRQDVYLRELTRAKQNAQMQEHFKNLEKKIIDDQVKCQQEQMKREQELKNHLQKKANVNKQGTVKPVKKIVHI
jgi:beta-lactamase regulating signal transducer with metallopeptidase domain